MMSKPLAYAILIGLAIQKEPTTVVNNTVRTALHDIIVDSNADNMLEIHAVVSANVI